jgi:hypothetical protein
MTMIPARNPRALPPGTNVDVRTRYQGAWCKGFVVHTARVDGYVLRRRIDDAILPKTFSANDVRPAD